MQAKGTPRPQFCRVHAPGRHINPHKFRHSAVTARSESDGQVPALVQGNSVAAQDRHYRVRQVRVAQQRFAEEMMERAARVVEEA